LFKVLPTCHLRVKATLTMSSSRVVVTLTSGQAVKSSTNPHLPGFSEAVRV